MSVIQIENLWKEYRLGVIGHGTLTQDLQSWWARKRGKEDPNSKIVPMLKGQEKQIEGNRFWALKGIDLEIKQGEILGIIGKNGAGKSTLLKILSRVTAPSKGNVKIKGRIASLLEVGTGFHPELTGKENIFLNGAILGMSKIEVKTKLDEIIAFSGVETFIDTPVKRYSSGMYVRLAFAVAAHLEPEVLVIDEVLAVGDAEFQKKCLGKMESISHEGRTILFVSHNLAAVKSLCKIGIVLSDGNLSFHGLATDAVDFYTGSGVTGQTEWNWEALNEYPGNGKISLTSISLRPLSGTIIDIDSGFDFECSFFNEHVGINLDFTVYFLTNENIMLFETGIILHSKKDSTKGKYTVKGRIPANLLNCGQYKINILFGEDQRHILLRIDDIISFTIENSATGRGNNFGRAPGVIRPRLEWNSNFLGV